VQSTNLLSASRTEGRLLYREGVLVIANEGAGLMLDCWVDNDQKVSVFM
jgi:hypothetical protein